MMGTGALLIVAAATWQIRATLWTTHSQRVGKALVEQFRGRQAALPVHSASGAGALAACASSSSTDQVKGLLLIPKLGVTAPVEDGVGDDQLNVAVGHLPASVWPGTAGTSVLEAHDVSYFVNLAQLSVGDVVQFQSPCTTYVFKVQGHDIVQQGTPVYNTSGPTMTLVTCWPTNALWYTPQRYLVTADLVSTSVRKGPSQSFVPASAAPTVAVPADLAAQGVTLATYSVPMGTMSLSGAPDPAWLQTTNPLLVEDSAVEGFIAGVRALSENRPDWWSSFAPSAPIPPALVGAKVSYKTSLNVNLSATGSTPTGVVLTVTAALSGGSAPGTYTMTVTETIQSGHLVVSNWVLTPA
jgi:sortase A